MFGCSCAPGDCAAKPDSCLCLEHAAAAAVAAGAEPAREPAYTADGRLRYSGGPVYECNAFCECDSSCTNRVVQHGRKLALDVFYTAAKGWGLRARDRIPAGTFVDTYVGELITAAAAAGRDRGDSYIFDLDLFDGADDDPGYSVDARVFGGLTRFVNHSCEPNLVVVGVVRNPSTSKIYDLAFFAARDIRPLEELCFDYQVGAPGPRDRVDRADRERAHEREKCRCGARRCRGYIWM
ncbi:SET domain-containing protein-containing protein [Dipodascopsis tothii]|uniref:SET domain-containing protein-containing protein n=1 Tax=Dipodascopsis tothii TaxID=44089 RepID=UPI0034CE04B7